MEIQSIRDRLSGALIGLARATDGSDHLITPESTAVIAAGLRALAQGTPEEMERLLQAVTEEKRKMVPNCFLCAAPCGRTDDYDMAQLRAADPEIRQIKLQLLSGICDLAQKANGDAAQFFYKALIFIGMDLDKSYLLPVLEELNTFTA